MERRLFPKVSNLQETVSKQLRLRCFTLCVHGDMERVESFEITQEARLTLGDASSNFPAPFSLPVYRP